MEPNSGVRTTHSHVRICALIPPFFIIYQNSSNRGGKSHTQKKGAERERSEILYLCSSRSTLINDHLEMVLNGCTHDFWVAQY